jgi:hypothetical protein
MQISTAINLPNRQVGAGGFGYGASLSLDFTSGNQTLDSRITFTRASTATRVNRSGVIESVAINTPRFDYNPVTLAPLGLLIEEQRTNLLLYSEELDTGWTNGTGATWQYSSGVSPAGTTTALGVDGLSGFSLTTTASTLYRAGTAITGSTAYTFSIYVRTKTGTANNVILRLSETGGNNTVSSAFTVTTDWTRISLSVTSAAGATSVSALVGTTSGSSNLYIWGAQLEAGAFATSYIPTVASQVTRSADLAVMTGTNFSSWYNATEGTFFAEVTPMSSDFLANRNIFLASDNTTTNFVGLRYISSGSQIGLGCTISNVSQASLLTGSMTAGTTYKVAGAFKANDFAISRNGGTVATDTSGTIPTVTQVEIGSLASVSSTSQRIKRLAFYQTRLTNAQLQSLSS